MAYQTPYIAILDVGHGNSTVLCDEGQTVIVDCGEKSAGLLEFLLQENITVINKIFISHSDKDHLGGLIGVISTQSIIVHEIILNADAMKGSRLWNDVLHELDQLHAKGITNFSVGISRSSHRIHCGRIAIEIVGPTPYLAGKAVGGRDSQNRIILSNSLSASFMISWDSTNLVYLAGDIDRIALDDLFRHDPSLNLNAQVLVYPHHGGKSEKGDSAQFAVDIYNAVRSDSVIFSIGRMMFSNPRPEVIAALRGRNARVRISCTQLSRNCAKTISHQNGSHLIGVYSRGREDNFCCSGTFLIALGNPFFLLPDYPQHLAFIRAASTTPLCISQGA